MERRKSKTDSVTTPDYILQALTMEFGPLFDPCPMREPFDPKVHPDGLVIDWGPVTFCNPPFSKTARFLRKAHSEWKQGKTIIFLMKTQATSSKAFAEYSRGAELRLLTGKVIFVGYEYPLLSPILLLVFRAGQTSDRFSCVDLLEKLDI